MSTALYRRYRPETFAEVIGQDHVTGPLTQALRADRVHHAYLFSGPRGCGKTTSARILARCLNCAQGPTDTPCGSCGSCRELARGGSGSLDVVEIDAASHGGVDDARELRERATFAPARDRYKIFIIDEAHMVTPQGFNALLKIVEEPPEHVMFVFATTEPEKVIGTIRSRTHHYPFHLVPPERLLTYLEQICASAGLRMGKGVLPLVVRAGAGSVRDALSVLDQLAAGATEEGVDYERAIALLGYTHAALLDDVVGAVAAGDGATVFRVVDRVLESGHDPRRFVEDLLERFRDLIVLQAVGDGSRSVFRALPEDQQARMQQQAAGFLPATLSRAADLANAALSEMTGATSPRLHLELLCARILLPGAENTERGLAARLDRLERRLAVSLPATEGVPVPTPPAPAPAATAGSREAAPAPNRASREPAAGSAPAPAAPAAAAAPPAAAEADGEAVRRMWPDVLERLASRKRVTWSLVSQEAQVLGYADGVLRLGFRTAGIATVFRGGAHAEFVRQALIDVLGLDARVEPVALEGGGTPRGGSVTAPPSGPGREPARPAGPPAQSAAPAEPGPAGEPEPPSDPEPPDPGPHAPDRHGVAGERRQSGPEPPGSVAPEHDVPSQDDPNAEDSGLSGPHVVERLLGGRVIDVHESP